MSKVLFRIASIVLASAILLLSIPREVVAMRTIHEFREAYGAKLDGFLDEEVAEVAYQRYFSGMSRAAFNKMFFAEPVKHFDESLRPLTDVGFFQLTHQMALCLGDCFDGGGVLYFTADHTVGKDYVSRQSFVHQMGNRAREGAWDYEDGLPLATIKLEYGQFTGTSYKILDHCWLRLDFDEPIAGYANYQCSDQDGFSGAWRLELPGNLDRARTVGESPEHSSSTVSPLGFLAASAAILMVWGVLHFRRRSKTGRNAPRHAPARVAVDTIAENVWQINYRDHYWDAFNGDTSQFSNRVLAELFLFRAWTTQFAFRIAANPADHDALVTETVSGCKYLGLKQFEKKHGFSIEDELKGDFMALIEERWHAYDDIVIRAPKTIPSSELCNAFLKQVGIIDPLVLYQLAADFVAQVEAIIEEGCFSTH